MAIHRAVDGDLAALAAVFALIDVRDVNIVLVGCETPGQCHGG
jgi:hypothetical protein